MTDMTQEERDRVRGARLRAREEAEVRLAMAREKAAEQATKLEQCVAALRERETLPNSSPSYEELKATYDEMNAAKATLFNLSQGSLVPC